MQRSAYFDTMTYETKVTPSRAFGIDVGGADARTMAVSGVVTSSARAASSSGESGSLYARVTTVT